MSFPIAYNCHLCFAKPVLRIDGRERACCSKTINLYILLALCHAIESHLFVAEADFCTQSLYSDRTAGHTIKKGILTLQAFIRNRENFHVRPNTDWVPIANSPLFMLLVKWASTINPVAVTILCALSSYISYLGTSTHVPLKIQYCRYQLCRHRHFNTNKNTKYQIPIKTCIIKRSIQIIF